MTPVETWERFRAEAEGCGTHLISELKECWQSLHDLIAAQAKAFRTASEIQAGPLTLDSLDDIFETHARHLLLEPIEKYRRERPQQRAIRAFDDWDRALEGVIRAMPEYMSVSGPEWIAMTGKAGLSFYSRIALRWRREQKRFPFRRSLLYGFHLHRAARRSGEGRLLHAFADAILDLITPWQAMLRIWLMQLVEPEHSAGYDREFARLRRRLSAHDKRAARAFKELEQWLTHTAEKTANCVPPGRWVPHNENSLKLSERYFDSREFWVRQSRAVDSDLDLDYRLALAERDLTVQARGLLTSIRKEHGELLDELGQVMRWLEGWKQKTLAPFPPAQAQIVSTASLQAAWEHFTLKALEHVPESIEVSSRLAARSGWRRSWKAQTPRHVFQTVMERQTEGVIFEGLEQMQRQHQSIVQQIERAREVVTFASETGRDAGPGDLQIEREGIENARSLLAFHLEQTQQVPPGVERSFALGLAAASLRAHTALEEGQFGVMRYGLRYGLPTAIQTLWRFTVQNLRRGFETGGRISADVYREALIRIGLSPAPTARIEHVVTRGYLSNTLGGDFHPERLPMIYQRLFRLAPLDDPRFLIGRQDEIAALASARELWENEREAGVIIVGERGSGKTSLLNCALQSTLAGPEVIRGEFSERLLRQEQMYEFLGRLLDVKPQDLEKDLKSRRRIIVLEEMERTFLRRVNHFEALRTLLNLISRTSKQTLWVLSTNYFSFRLLNSAVRLDPHFSHRINAMAVDRKHLREAILMRHNLSGLRLLFAPPPAENTYADRFRKAAGVELNLETEFFDAIYRESGGVFRTAFALWQRYIDRAEGGILYMRPAATPQYDKVLGSLNDFDLFTLAAIMQHGSLTPSEHSRIFRIDQATSSAWLDNLLARELIEPDAGRPGLRVIPEAGELVRRTLFQRNVG